MIFALWDFHFPKSAHLSLSPVINGGSYTRLRVYNMKWRHLRFLPLRFVIDKIRLIPFLHAKFSGVPSDFVEFCVACIHHYGPAFPSQRTRAVTLKDWDIKMCPERSIVNIQKKFHPNILWVIYFK